MASLAVLGLVTSWNDYFTPLIFLINKQQSIVSSGIKG